MTPNSRKILKETFPELAHQFSQEDTNDLLSKVFSSVSMLKGDKGDKGEPGYTPVLGKDYMTRKDIANILYHVTPVKGKQYFTDEEAKSFLQSATPVKGKDYFDGKEGKRGEIGKSGRDGKDGSPDEPMTIVKKLASLKGENRLNISAIHGAVKEEEFTTITKKLQDGMILQDGRIKLIDQRWGGHGGGLSKVIHDDTLTGDGTGSSPLSVVGGGGGGTWQAPQTPSGLIDGINTVYALTYTPLIYSGIITIRGKVYDELIDWTISGSTITFTSPLPARLSGSTFRFKGQI